MSDVTDGGHTDLNPFDLTNTVTTAASKASQAMVVPIERMQEPGVVKELWNGLLDDILGPKTARA